MKTDNNGQRKTQTVHVAIPHEILRRIKALAHWDKRSMSSQTLWLIEKGLEHYGQARQVR